MRDEGAQPIESMPLTDEHRMLLQIRDALYEQNWDDFITDLRARATGKPHVFATVSDAPDMKNTIAHHLELIAAMHEWERKTGRLLSAG